MTLRLIPAILLPIALAACVTVPAPAPVETAPVVTPVASVSGVAGLQAREPDACHAGDYRSAVGQPASVIPTLGITRKYRVVEYRGIEPQEYDSLRIVFRLDAAGNIQNVDCG